MTSLDSPGGASLPAEPLSPVTLRSAPVRAVVVMGVSGSGKTSVGQALAAAAGWSFREGDEMHPLANVEKMSAGVPLTDKDRWPWLRDIRDWILAQNQRGEPVVVSCSALKRSYRDLLREAGATFVYVHGSRELLVQRMGHRTGHFMPASLLDSQLATLEDPRAEQGVVTLDAESDLGSEVQTALAALGIAPAISDEALGAQVAQIIERAASGTLPEIVTAGNPVLRQIALPWRGQFAPEMLKALAEIMRRTMHAAPGVGLAAPQIGVPLQMAVLEDQFPIQSEVKTVRERDPLAYFGMLNPSYQPLTDGSAEESSSFFEGCLSIPGWQAVVSRSREVQLDYLNLDGEPQSRRLSGWQARIAQHETDHAQGILYLDRAELRSLCSNLEYEKNWAKPMIYQARQGLGF